MSIVIRSLFLKPAIVVIVLNCLPLSRAGVLVATSQITKESVYFSSPTFADATAVKDIYTTFEGSPGEVKTGALSIESNATGFSLTTTNLRASSNLLSNPYRYNYAFTYSGGNSPDMELSYSVGLSYTNNALESFIGLVVDPTTRLLGLEIRALDPVLVDNGYSNTFLLYLPSGWANAASSASPNSTQIVNINSSWTLDTSTDPNGLYDEGSDTLITLTNANSDGTATGLDVILWSSTIVPVPERPTFAAFGFGLLLLMRGTLLRTRRTKRRA